MNKDLIDCVEALADEIINESNKSTTSNTYMNLEPNITEKFLAGFDLAGKRTNDGRLQSYLDKNTYFPFNEWPTVIQMYGNEYTLEDIVYGTDGYESALYV